MSNSPLSLLLLSAGIALTSATQLRFGGLPVGPGELLLVAWMGLTALSLVRPRTIDLSPALSAMLVFWSAALVACIGALLLMTPERFAATSSSMLHDLTALVFAAAVTLLLTAPADVATRARRSAFLVLVLTIFPLLALWAVGQWRWQVGPIFLWYGPRFVGWTTNPNQLALLTVPAPFLAAALATRSRGLPRLLALLLAAGAVFLGLQTLSDALMLSWGAAGGLVAMAGWIRAGAGRGRGGMVGRTVFVGATLVLLAIGYELGPRLEEQARSAGYETFSAGDQGSERVHLWRAGVAAMLRSPIVGLGPGAHAGDERVASIDEAHNTLIDWGASTGLVGLLAYVGLLTWSFVVVWRRGGALLAGLLVSMLVFSLFHYVLRQPIYWWYLISAIALATGDRAVDRQPRLAPRWTRPGGALATSPGG